MGEAMGVRASYTTWRAGEEGATVSTGEKGEEGVDIYRGEDRRTGEWGWLQGLGLE